MLPLVIRVIKLSLNLNFVGVLRAEDDEAIWQYYMAGTLSIEILKDNELQKLYFRCRDKVRKYM